MIAIESVVWWETPFNDFTQPERVAPDSTPLETSSLQKPTTFLAAGWDMVGEASNGTSDVWIMPAAGGYPELSAFSEAYARPPLRGKGTPEAPYEIDSSVAVGALWHYDAPQVYARLTSDLDLTGIVVTPSLLPLLQGILDGAGHEILGLRLQPGNSSGLVGVALKGSEIRNLTLLGADVKVIGSSGRVGILVGENYGRIANCHTSDGSVTHDEIPGDVRVSDGGFGGLAGYNHGTIEACSSSNLLTLKGDRVGGLVGRNEGLIDRCAAGGTLESIEPDDSFERNSYFGGLVGSNSNQVGFHEGFVVTSYARIVSSYARATLFATPSHNGFGGLVGGITSGTVEQCYAASQFTGDIGMDGVGGLIGSNTYSGETTRSYFLGPQEGGGSDNGFGILTSADAMSHQATFIDWDFDDTWMICEGQDYPRLQWEEVDCTP